MKKISPAQKTTNDLSKLVKGRKSPQHATKVIPHKKKRMSGVIEMDKSMWSGGGEGGE